MACEVYDYITTCSMENRLKTLFLVPNRHPNLLFCSFVCKNFRGSKLLTLHVTTKLRLGSLHFQCCQNSTCQIPLRLFAVGSFSPYSQIEITLNINTSRKKKKKERKNCLISACLSNAVYARFALFKMQRFL